MKIETDDQLTEKHEFTKSLYEKMGMIGDTLTHPQNIDFSAVTNQLPTYNPLLRSNTRPVTTGISSVFKHFFLRALRNRQWERCIDYAFAHLCLKDDASTAKPNAIARLFATTNEDTDVKRVNGMLGFGVGTLFVILVISLIYAFFTDMIASVMMLFGIYGFIIMLFGFAILVVIIGIYFATR